MEEREKDERKEKRRRKRNINKRNTEQKYYLDTNANAFGLAVKNITK